MYTSQFRVYKDFTFLCIRLFTYMYIFYLIDRAHVNSKRISLADAPAYIHLWNNGRSDNVNNKCSDETDQVWGLESAKLNVGRRRTAADLYVSRRVINYARHKPYRGQTRSQQDGLISSKLQRIPLSPLLFLSSERFRLWESSQNKVRAMCETNWRQIERYSRYSLRVFPKSDCHDIED